MACRHPRMSGVYGSESVIIHTSNGNLPFFTLQSHPGKKVTLVTTRAILNYDRTRPKRDRRRQLQKSKLRWASALKGTCPVWHRTDWTDLLVHKAIGLDRIQFLARKRDAHLHGRSALIFQQHVCNYDSRKVGLDGSTVSGACRQFMKGRLLSAIRGTANSKTAL
jgi:hypothetical protein